MKQGRGRPRPITMFVALVAVLFVMVAGCAVPPDSLNNSAKGLEGEIQAVKTDIKKAEGNFKVKLSKPEFAFAKNYSPADTRADRFTTAGNNVKQAEVINNEQVKPLLDKYSNEKQGQLEAAVANASKLLADARALAADPGPWADKVLATQKDPRGTVRKAATAAESAQAIFNQVGPDVANAKANYARNGKAIEAKFQPLDKQHAAALQANGLLQAEAAKSSPNYAVMTTHAETVHSNAAALQKDAPALQAQLAELNTRETHTIRDMRVDSAVVITRVSWLEDDYTEFPTETEYDYAPRPVDQDTANYFAQFQPDDTLASEGWGFSTDMADRGQWDKLHIDPNEQMPSGDNTSSFSLGELEETYCHQIQVIKNGKTDSSGRPNPADNACSKYDKPGDVSKGLYWVEAEELNPDAIGMDSYAKGAGDFVDQASEEPTPAGMAYVGDPATGQWVEQANGTSVWEFLGPYLLISNLMGGPGFGYSRAEYDDWDRHYRYKGSRYYGNTYYGTYRGKPRYGKDSPIFATYIPRGSQYARSGLRDATVRNAGVAARAGGPGGGGK